MAEQAASETTAEITTEFTEIEMRCVPCNTAWSAPVVRRVNVATHPDAWLGILLKTMHRTACPLCKKPREIDTIFDYYDPERRLVVQVRPAWEIRAGGGEDWYWARSVSQVRELRRPGRCGVRLRRVDREVPGRPGSGRSGTAGMEGTAREGRKCSLAGGARDR